MVFKRKRTYGGYRRRSTSKRPMFRRKTGKSKTVSRKYGVRSYSKKRTFFKNPVKAEHLNRTNYVKYVYQSTASGDITCPVSTSMNSGSNAYIQAGVYLGATTLKTLANIDPFVENYAQMYKYFRMKYVWMEIAPKWNMSNLAAGTGIGEITMVPLNTSETILRSGQTSFNFGSTPDPNMTINIDYWKNVKGAKTFKFTKPGQKMRIRVPLVIFKYDVAFLSVGLDPMTSQSTYSLEPQKAPWLECVNVADRKMPDGNNIQHFGVMAFFSGWETSSTDTFKFELRTYRSVEFRQYNAQLEGLFPSEDASLNQKFVGPNGLTSWPKDAVFFKHHDRGEEMSFEISDAETEIVDPPYPKRLPDPVEHKEAMPPPPPRKQVSLSTLKIK